MGDKNKDTTDSELDYFVPCEKILVDFMDEVRASKEGRISIEDFYDPYCRVGNYRLFVYISG